MIDRIENLTREGKQQGINDAEIKKNIAADPLVIKLSRRFQTHYGFADCGAVLTGTVKGHDIQQIAAHTMNGLTNWDAAIPLAIFGVGLAKTFSNNAGKVIDSLTPAFIVKALGTSCGILSPSRIYGAGYVIAGLGAVSSAMAFLSPDMGAISAKTLCLAGAYASWARGYFAIDEIRPEPMSAQNYRQRLAQPIV